MGPRRPGQALTERQVIARTTKKTTPTSRILCYHTVGMPKLGINDVTLQRIERQLAAAKDAATGSYPPRSWPPPTRPSPSLVTCGWP